MWPSPSICLLFKSLMVRPVINILDKIRQESIVVIVTAELASMIKILNSHMEGSVNIYFSKLTIVFRIMYSFFYSLE